MNAPWTYVAGDFGAVKFHYCHYVLIDLIFSFFCKNQIHTELIVIREKICLFISERNTYIDMNIYGYSHHDSTLAYILMKFLT